MVFLQNNRETFGSACIDSIAVGHAIRPFRKIIAVLLMLPAFFLGAGWSGKSFAQVYKSVAPDGSITYSDGPSTPNQSPESLTPIPIYTAPPPAVAPSAQAPAKNSQAPFKYQSIRLVEPVHDATIRDNSGVITIRVNVQPKLNTDAGDQIVIQVDGVDKGEPVASTTATVSGVERGTHQISASIRSKDGATILQSDAVSIHLHRQVVSRPH